MLLHPFPVSGAAGQSLGEGGMGFPGRTVGMSESSKFIMLS